jgi:hypothetical protein
MDYGDKAVQMGIKTGTYTPADFIADISAALDITWLLKMRTLLGWLSSKILVCCHGEDISQLDV